MVTNEKGDKKMTITKILLVDDEKPFVETLMKRLKKRDIEIVAAFNGQEALDCLSEDDGIEVVILDIKMPVMDGMTALKEIKNRHPLVEVIMLTGHATVETGIDGMKEGAFDYLMKPCDMEQLIAKVQEAATRKRKHEQKIMEARVQAITLRRP
jgi:DNA-binding NtrC family response regulator